MRCSSALSESYKLEFAVLNQLLIDPAAMKWLVERTPEATRSGFVARIFQLMRMVATVTFSGRKGCVFYSCWSETAMVTPQRCRLLRSKVMRFLDPRLKNIYNR